MATVQGIRTFGEKPKSFQIEDGGELYYVGSEVSSDIVCIAMAIIINLLYYSFNGGSCDT